MTAQTLKGRKAREAQNRELQERRSRLVDWTEVMRRTKSAANAALPGDAWSKEDREDCAATLRIKLLERVPLLTLAPLARMPVRVTFWDVLDPGAILRGAPTKRYPERIPARMCALSWLTACAGDWRESVKAQRERDALLETVTSEREFQPKGSRDAELAELAASTPTGALQVSGDLLRRSGASTGTCNWSAALIALYSYMRAAGDTGKVGSAAEELSMTPAAHRKQVSRGIQWLTARGSAEDYLRSTGTRYADREGNAVAPGYAPLPVLWEPRRSVKVTKRLDLRDWRSKPSQKLRRSDGRGGAAEVLYGTPWSFSAGILERTLPKRQRRAAWTGKRRADWTYNLTGIGLVGMHNRCRSRRLARAARTLQERAAKRAAEGIASAPPVLTYDIGSADACAAPKLPEAPRGTGQVRTPVVPGGKGRKLAAQQTGGSGESGHYSETEQERVPEYVPMPAPTWSLRYLTGADGWLKYKVTRAGTLRRATKRDRT